MNVFISALVATIIFIAGILILNLLATISIFGGFAIIWTILKVILVASFIIYLVRLVAGVFPTLR